MNRKGFFSWSGFGGVVKGNPPGTAFQFAPLGRTFAGAFGHDGINTGLDVAGCTVVCAGAFTDIQVGDLHPHISEKLLVIITQTLRFPLWQM